MLEKLAFLAILASRKAVNRKDIGTVDRIPKLDVEGSNPFARSQPTPQGPEAAKAAPGPSF
jgi:hypothetical protein